MNRKQILLCLSFLSISLITSACATKALVRVPVGKTVTWTYHPIEACEPEWHTSNPKIAFPIADNQEPFTVIILGRHTGKAKIQLLCGKYIYSELVEVFRDR